MRRKTTEEFIKEAKKIHGNRYDYSKVKYINYYTKVIIGCKLHGYFSQIPATHINNGSGCIFCGRKSCGEKKNSNTEEFIKKAIKIHGNKYDYSKVNYINAKTKVEIICKQHGIFNQIPDKHLSGNGCKFCGYKSNSIKQILGKEKFIEMANKIHNNKYDYSLSEYVNNNTKIKIICQANHIFEQTPDIHLRGNGCKYCSGNYNSNTEEFIKKAIKIHGNKYDYSKVNYINAKTKVEIICSKCGIFEQTPTTHLSGCGCIYCRESRGEREIFKILDKIIIKYERQKIFIYCRYKWPLKFDFYIPEIGCIEFDGIQHYEPIEYWGGINNFKEIKKRDQIKKNYCKDNNIPLYIIKYDENIEEKMKEILKQLKKNYNKRIFEKEVI